MKFMLMVKATGYSEAGVRHDQTHINATLAFKAALAAAGVWLADEVLEPSSRGIRIIYPLHEQIPVTQAGPFPVDPSVLAQFYLIEVPSEDEALQWAYRIPIPKDQGEYEIEIRSVELNERLFREPRTEALEAELLDQLDMLHKIKS
ncbi:YciI family protein [Paenibacillus sp. N1-5-1-14]|uniref:YciI family protein n=1 Tax=Paenibacillus radicibacter TaxID=2972488 RepID=UPI0021599E76|nr:YciI family protein [Paenibacillus radicibacter]MCR8643796.1 YciI family protein [Paenibacillus radicibacter]